MSKATPFLAVGLCAGLMAFGVLRPWLLEGQYGFLFPPLGTPHGDPPERWWNGLSPFYSGSWVLAFALLCIVSTSALALASIREMKKTVGIGGRVLTVLFMLSVVLVIRDLLATRDLTQSPVFQARGGGGLTLTVLASLAGSILGFWFWPLPVRGRRRRASPPPLEVFD